MKDTIRPSVERFLNQFVQAWRAVELYPRSNPRIREALAAALHAAHEIGEVRTEAKDHWQENGSPLDADFIIVRVTQDAFLFEGEPMARQREPLRRLAGQLHEHGVKLLWLRPGMKADELEQLLTAVAGANTVNEFEDALPKLDFEHIGLEVIENFQLVERNQASGEMDMLSYLRSKQARRQGPFGDSDILIDELPEDDAEDISDLAEFFLEIAQGSEEKTQYLYNNLSDPRRLAETLTYLAKMRPLQETNTETSLDLVQQALGHIADTIKQLPPESREDMVRNIAEAILTTDKSVRERITNTALAAEVGKTSFVADICTAFPDDVIAQLLSAHIRLHSGTANTISNFFEDFADDKQRRETIKHLLKQELQHSDASHRHQIVSLLAGQAGENSKTPKRPTLSTPAERETTKRTREARARELTLLQSELVALNESVGCVSPQDDLERAVLNIMSLRNAGHIAQLDTAAWDCIRTALEHAVDHGHFVFAANCLAQANSLAHQTRDEHARKTVAEFTDHLTGKTLLDRLIQAVIETGPGNARYHTLLGLLAQLGERAYEALFQALAEEPNRRMRRRLILAFIDLGEDTAYFLIRMTEHPQWYVVRNVVYLLGKLRSPAGINALERVRDYPDIRVRREVLRAAASIRGPEAERLLRRSLDDPEPVIRGLAAEWLGIINADGTLEEFRTLLEKGDKRLRTCQEFAAGVVRALGRIGDRSDLPLIERFKDRSRGFGIIRHEGVAQACEQAIDDIRRRLPDEVVTTEKEIEKE
ncbi:MAG: HEAT repeat domain-containing protein [Candidatus Hydrogenedentota bacterium]